MNFDLHNAGVVSEIEKRETTMDPMQRDPPANPDPPAHVIGRQLAAEPGPRHPDEPAAVLGGHHRGLRTGGRRGLRRSRKGRRRRTAAAAIGGDGNREDAAVLPRRPEIEPENAGDESAGGS